MTGPAIAFRLASELVPYARNAKTHSAEQVADLEASIEAFGWTYPTLIDEADGIVAGHGRVLAAANRFVDYKPFRTNRLVLRPGVELADRPDDYGMRLFNLEAPDART